MDHIRFRGGQLQPVGGNVALPSSAVPGLPRDMLTWHDNSNPPVRWAAYGTDDKLYAYRFDTRVQYDITPAGVGPLGAPGAPVGYGTGAFGEDLYGTARDPSDVGVSDIAAIQGDRWSLDTFGEDLLIVPTQDGRLFVWSPATPGTPAAPVVAASGDTVPINNKGVVVTDQRQVVLIGADGDPRRVAWSDQENYTVWTAAITNLAGAKQLQTQSYAMNAAKVSQGILIWTSNDLHLMQYVGPPYAYGITQIASGCGLASLRAPVAIGSTVMWPGLQGFWMWAGAVQPVPCDVQDWFLSLINRNYIGRMFGSPNPAFAEMWWDWPDESSTECNRCIAYNYGHPAHPWIIGTRARTAADPTGTMDFPMLAGPLEAWAPDHTYTVDTEVVNGANVYVCTTGGVSGPWTSGGPSGTGTGIVDGDATWDWVFATVSGEASGTLFLHEYGWTDNGWPRASADGNSIIYAESGSIVLAEGDQRYAVTQIVPDAACSTDDMIGFSFTVRENPYDADSEHQVGPYTVYHNGMIDARFSGRTARMRLEALSDGPFTVGRTRLLMAPAGRR